MPDVVTIDCHYTHPQFAASYLIISDGKIAVVENNTSLATPHILKGIKNAGYSALDVELLIVTHAHLDHSGGTSSLLAKCPKATVLAHPKAARTLNNPEKLIKSAELVYGKEKFEALYGKIEPIANDRIRIMNDGESLHFKERELKFIYTLGHATHHFCIWDSVSNGVFTGDAFGLRYPALQKKGLFIFPSTSPIDFDPIEAKKSLEKILETGADKLFLTHYGEVNEIKEAKIQMLMHLDKHEEILTNAIATSLAGEKLLKYCYEELAKHFESTIQSRGISRTDAWPLIQFDIDLNAQGIAYVAQKRQKSSHTEKSSL